MELKTYKVTALVDEGLKNKECFKVKSWGYCEAFEEAFNALNASYYEWEIVEVKELVK